VVQRELTIVAARGKRPSYFEIALDLLDRGDVKLGPLISHRFQLEQWAAAFETASGSGTKVVVETFRCWRRAYRRLRQPANTSHARIGAASIMNGSA
jgi:hypothetical protein